MDCGICSPIRDWTQATAVKAQNPNHWATGEHPPICLISHSWDSAIFWQTAHCVSMSILSKFWLYNDSTQDLQLGTEIMTFLVSSAVVMWLSSGQWEVEVGCWPPLLPAKQNEEVVGGTGAVTRSMRWQPCVWLEDGRATRQQPESEDHQSPHQLWADCIYRRDRGKNIFLVKPPIIWLFCQFQPFQRYLVQTLAVLGALLCGTAMSALAAL